MGLANIWISQFCEKKGNLISHMDVPKDVSTKDFFHETFDLTDRSLQLKKMDVALVRFLNLRKRYYWRFFP